MSLAYPISDNTRPRGQSRVRRNTYDIDSPEASIHAPLDATLEGARLAVKALLETVREVQIETANALRYSQGFITDAAIKALTVMLDPKHGYDYWSGTNDLAGSQVAAAAGIRKRTWQRVKKDLGAFGILSSVHRSIKTGLEKAPGVDQDIQISDLYYFSLAKLVPWLRERVEEKLARWRREQYARHHREGTTPPRTTLVKRDRPKCRIPAKLNPVRWAQCLAAIAAAKAKTPKTYAAREAEAVAFAKQYALDAPPG